MRSAVAAFAVATLLVACSRESNDDAASASEPTKPTEEPVPAAQTTAAFEPKMVDLGDGLKVELYAPGNGAQAALGSRVTLHYEARVVGKPETFDSTHASGIPLELVLGSHDGPTPIEGLTRGLIGLSAGSRAKITIPAKLAWGESGNAQIGVPPGAEVSFAVEVLSVK